MLSLRCWADISLVVASRGCSLGVACKLLTAVASPVAEHGFQGTRAVVVVGPDSRAQAQWL